MADDKSRLWVELIGRKQAKKRCHAGYRILRAWRLAEELRRSGVHVGGFLAHVGGFGIYGEVW